jgi:plasmid stabilization system protein ParE
LALAKPQESTPFIMRRRVLSRPHADADIDDVAAWYDAERPGLGDDFVEAVNTIATRIAGNALQFPVVTAVVRRALMRRFPYGVFFVVDDKTATIIAVLHLHRGPAALMNRILPDG